MASFCFKCKACGHRLTTNSPDMVTYCEGCEQYDTIVRDYKAEAVGVDLGMLRAARG